MHLANAIIRGSVGISIAQAVGAASEGVAFGALRWRTNTIWPLMVLHALHDTLLQVMTCR